LTAAIFGLLGVIVGGLTQSLGTWALERRRDGWTVTKSARLLMPHLNGVDVHLERIANDDAHVLTWDQLQQSVTSFQEAWNEHSPVFAGSLEFEPYMKLYRAHRAFARLAMYAPTDTTKAINVADIPLLADIRQARRAATLECGVLAMGGRDTWRGLRRLLAKRRLRKLTSHLTADNSSVPPSASS
jgi:hypothetical protein